MTCVRVGLCVIVISGCAAVIGADFDRELGPPADDGSDAVDGGVAGDDGGETPSDGAAKDGGIEPTDDGGLVTFYKAPLNEQIQDVFTNGTDVFWTTLDALFAPAHVTLRARGVDGKNERVVAETPTSGNAGGIGRCYALAAGGDTLWLANSADQSTGAIGSTSAGGTSLIDRVTNEDQPCVLALLKGRPYWSHSTLMSLRTSIGNGAAVTVTGSLLAESLAADGTSLFADSNYNSVLGGRAVFRIEVDASGMTASVVPLFQDSPGPIGGLTLGPSHVFWADMGTGNVLSVPKAGGSAVTVASGLGSPRFVAYRDAYLYFTAWPSTTTRNAGTVARIRVQGGTPTGTIDTIASGRDFPRRLSVDATHLYWVDGGDASNAGARIVRTRVATK